ncbi:MAG: ABC transporter substrate-binding protein [Sinobacteraceae bacterium]|nr:ABC transporter substrate-binding protein [Nevskiaceae bacterium]MBV8853086.1 ABC transporter substrate-binding protein [Nevskiaceae bacterium]MBV9913741.1 ABC transporter substrate-binding protein [Nevskiaceae bacterium]
MRWTRTLIGAAALALLQGMSPAGAADEIVIGDIDDFSGVYADTGGTGAVEAIRMAIADFGGTVLGRKITLLTTDHQNKPDIGASKFREWADQNGLSVLFGGSNTGVSIAMAKVAAAKKIPFFAIGAGGASLTNEDCTAYSIHYVYDTTALANGTATAVLNAGGKTWFYLQADYAFGAQLQSAAAKIVEANGGRNIGTVRVPLAAVDFSSFLLQAQASGAQILGLANAGGDFSNSLKAATEFGITKKMRPAALLAFITDIHSVGLQTAQGLYLTTAWYWDLNDQTRAFGRRFFEKVKRMPTMDQAGYYSATLTYLKAVRSVGSTDADKVMNELKRARIDDVFTHSGYVRSDGVMVHDMYVMQVKSPQESRAAWDYYKVVKVMSGEAAFGPITGLCPLARK